MIFYILLGIVAAIVLVTFVGFIIDGDIEEAFMFSFAYAFFGAIISGVILLVLGLIATGGHATATPAGEDHYKLRAIGTSNGVNGKVTGSLYLTTGYINTTRVLNYTWQDSDGDVHVDSANGTDSVVREDGGTTVDVHHWRLDGPWWLVPWDFGHTDTYTFHVPAGSVQGGYEVGAK